jgi:hypothetical protein
LPTQHIPNRCISCQLPNSDLLIALLVFFATHTLPTHSTPAASLMSSIAPYLHTTMSLYLQRASRAPWLLTSMSLYPQRSSRAPCLHTTTRTTSVTLSDHKISSSRNTHKRQEEGSGEAFRAPVPFATAQKIFECVARQVRADGRSYVPQCQPGPSDLAGAQRGLMGLVMFWLSRLCLGRPSVYGADGHYPHGTVVRMSRTLHVALST